MSLIDFLSVICKCFVGARRLLDAVKKKRAQQRKRNLLTKLIPAAGKQTTTKKQGSDDVVANFLTCLIQEKDITLSIKLGDGSFGVVRRGGFIS